MSTPNPQRVAVRFARQKHAGQVKTAGEVRFIKDRGGDKGEWAWNTPGPSEREIHDNFLFNARHLKPLAQVLRSTLMALGHATSAHARFVKIKSRNVSPDGNLGGKGYIQKITDMRRQLMNSIEALSAIGDTVHDELNAPHWDPAEDTLDSRDREEVKEIVEDAEAIKEDPEGWAEDQEDELDEDSPQGKTARVKHRPLQRSLLDAQTALNNLSHRVQNLQGRVRSMKINAEEAEQDFSFEDSPRFFDTLVQEADELASLAWHLHRTTTKADVGLSRYRLASVSSERVASRYLEKNHE